MATDTILAPELLAEKRKLRRRLVLAGIAVVLLGALAYQARPIYRLIKSWRCSQLVAQAEKAVKDGNYDEATRLAQAAYQLKFDQPSAIRLVARLNSRSGHPRDAVPFWQQLMELPGFDQDDRRDYASDLLKGGSPGEAEAQLRILLDDQPENPQNLRLAAQIAAVSNRRTDAIAEARRASRIDPQDVEGRLLLASLLAGSSEPKERDEGLSQLLALAVDQGQVGLEALTALAKRPDLPKDKLKTLIPLLNNHPLATEGHRLLAVDVHILAEPEKREQLITAAVEARKDSEPAALRDLAVWLNAKNDYERAIAVLPERIAITRRDLFLVYLDAVAALGRWPQIRKLLEKGDVPLDNAIKELYLARSAAEMKDLDESDIHWKRAQFAALHSPEQLISIATYAEKIGRLDQAEIAYRTLASSPATARPAYLALMRVLSAKEDTPALRELLGDMLQRWPKDAAVRNDFAYLNLLEKKNIAQSMNTALELMAANPASLPHRTTLALAYLRVGQVDAARRVYEGIIIDWKSASGSSRAVYAAVLAANGDMDAAQAQVADLRVDKLRPEERELVGTLR